MSVYDQDFFDLYASAFANCAAIADTAATQARIYGDLACARELERKARYYWWGQKIMNNTLPEGDDTCCKCVTPEFALAVIEKLSPGCVDCCCPNVPITCDIDVTYTVFMAADASFEPSALPNTYYLIVSNLANLSGGWADHVNEIVYNTTYTSLVAGNIVYDATLTDYYVFNDQDELTPLFPRLDGEITGTTLTITSPYPDTNAYLGRDMVIETSLDATTWTATYSGTEAIFATPQDFTVALDTIYIRTTYYTNDFQCPYGPFMGVVEPNTGRSFSFPGISSYFSSTPLAQQLSTLAGIPEFTISMDIRSANPAMSCYILDIEATDSSSRCIISCDSGDIILTVDLTTIPASWGATYRAIGAATTLFDNSWRNMAIIREAQDLATTAPRFFLDGIEVLMTLDTASGPFTTFSALSDVYVGPVLGSVGIYKLANVYTCNTARTPADVLNIIVPNAMEGNDSTWGRMAYWRPTDTDAAGAPPYVSSNVGSGVPHIRSVASAVIDPTDGP